MAIPPDPSFDADDDVHILPPDVFEYIFRSELKRALRAQNFVTLAIVHAGGERHDSRDTVRTIARVISSGIRETDLVGATPEGQVSIVLLDTDPDNALRAIDRVVCRLKQHFFSPPLNFAVGIASCPTQGCDAQALRAAAGSDLASSSRNDRGWDRDRSDM
jgi:GGDEF domain-containing protein